jgi:hypothetical protein
LRQFVPSCPLAGGCDAVTERRNDGFRRAHSPAWINLARTGARRHWAGGQIGGERAPPGLCSKADSASLAA